MDPIIAGEELRGLVEGGLVEQDGVGRWTNYRLKVAKEIPIAPASNDDRIIAFVRENGSTNNRECQELLGVDATRAYYLLRKLVNDLRLNAGGTGKDRKYRLP